MKSDHLWSRVVFVTVCLLLLSLSAYPQEKSRLQQVWNRLQNHLDSSAAKKVDARYIEIPDKPWRVVLRTKTNGFGMELDSRIDQDFIAARDLSDDISDEVLTVNTRIQPSAAQAVGLFIGYRGLGFGYSIPLLKNAGRYIAFSATGTNYGLNFRLRRFPNSNIAIKFEVQAEGLKETIETDADISEPMMVRSVIVDGYYLFNGHRFSQASAYNQSVIQRHSAGSLMLGALYHQSSLDMVDKHFLGLIQMNGDIGKVSIRQMNLGVFGQYNHFDYGHSDTKVGLSDWYVRASLGLRF